MQRPECALIGGALDDVGCEVRRVAANREVTEDEPRLPGRDQSLDDQRLNLSREPLAAASSEVAEVANLHRRIRLPEHMPLRAHALVHTHDLGR